MKQEKLTFIEESGLVLESFGMTRMAGRVFGYLMVCDEDAVSFDDIRNALDASKGSISGTTKQLINSGLIEQLSLPGDRKTYFRVSQMHVGEILKARTHFFKKFATILAKGREIKNREDKVSDWLLEISTFYNWIGGEIDKIIDRWELEKDSIIQQNQQGNEKEKQQ